MKMSKDHQPKIIRKTKKGFKKKKKKKKKKLVNVIKIFLKKKKQKRPYRGKRYENLLEREK